MEGTNNQIRVKAIYPEMLSGILVPKLVKRQRFHENRYVCNLCENYEDVYKNIYNSINKLQVTETMIKNYETNKSEKFSYDNIKAEYKKLFEKVEKVAKEDESKEKQNKLSNAMLDYFNFLYHILFIKKIVCYANASKDCAKINVFISDEINESDMLIWEEEEMYENDDSIKNESKEEKNKDYKIPKKMKCDICQKLYKDPIVALRCDHNFCKNCIANILEKKCPICKEK